MSKTTKILLPIIISVILIAGFAIMLTSILKDNIKNATVTCNISELKLEVGDVVNLNNYFTITPSEAEVTITCLVTNANFATISGNNILTAKNVGETTIVFKTSLSSDICKENISLTIKEKSIIPSNFSFEEENVTLSLDMLNYENKIICEENYNVIPTVSYSVSNICNYNIETGIITPLNEGNTVVTVTFMLNNNIISKSFNVNVVNKYLEISIDLSFEENSYILNMNINSVKSFNYCALINNVADNSYKFLYTFISNDANIEIIQFESGLCTIYANKTGVSFMKVYLKDFSNIYKIIKIEVE